jgi:hypothetical protein
LQLLEPLRHLTYGRHAIDHTTQVRLAGRKDVPLLSLAKQRGYECVVQMVMVNSMILERHVPSLAAAWITSATRNGTKVFVAFLSVWVP